MVLSMDRCASGRSRFILCGSDDEDLSKDCYCMKDLGGDEFPVDGQGR